MTAAAQDPRSGAKGGGEVSFAAPEYQADGSIRIISYAIAGAPGEGWEIRRAGAPWRRLGPGYRLLRVSHCGVCATDLARRHLPFPLPQVTGHEVVAVGAEGGALAVEINASHVARGLDPHEWCAHCAAGLDTHCPARLVVGIHDLPGGFGPWMLAPVANVVPVPAAIGAATATLVEPFAAALHAVESLASRAGDRVAVLGPRRLGSLVIAALAALRAARGLAVEIVAIVRRPEIGALARDLGADLVVDAATVASATGFADVVVDTTGSPEGIAVAARLARREVHVKSTTGLPAFGLAHMTDLVVDEVTLEAYETAMAMEFSTASEFPAALGLESTLVLEQTAAAAIGVATEAAAAGGTMTAPRVTAGATMTTPGPGPRATGAGGRATAAVLGNDVPAAVVEALVARGHHVVSDDDAGNLARRLAADPAVPLDAADLVVVASSAAVDAAIRPHAAAARGLVRPRGVVAIVDVGQSRDPLLHSLLDRGIRITATRCGAFAPAIALLAETSDLGRRLGERMVTDVLPATRCADAFARAAAPDAVKVIVAHPDGLL